MVAGSSSARADVREPELAEQPGQARELLRDLVGIERNLASVMSFRLKVTVWTLIALVLFGSGTRVGVAEQNL